jgi:DNA primase
MEVRVVLFPDGDDPDSFARKTDTETLKSFLSHQAQNFLAFKANILMAEAANDPLKKAEVLRQMADSLALIRDNFSRITLIQDCAQRMEVPEEMLVSEINRRIRKRISDRSQTESKSPELEETTTTDHAPELSLPDPAQSHKEIQRETAQIELIRLAVLYGERILHFSENDETFSITALTYILDELAKDDIQLPSPLAQAFLATLDVLDQEERWAEIQSVLIGHENPEVQHKVLDFLQSPYQLSQYWEERHNILTDREDTLLKKTLAHSLISVKMNVLIDRADALRECLKELQEQQRSSESENQPELQQQSFETLAEIGKIQKLVLRFAAELTRVIIR